MSDPLFELDEVVFRHEAGRAVLEGATFALAAGERVGLTGANGSGKTTLLELMVGLNKPQGGRLRAFGRPRVTEEDFHEVRLRAGLLFQDPDDQLFCATVAEDVAFGPFNLGWPRERVAEAVRETLGRLGLAGYERRVAHHLSYGERRLVCLATVLAMEPAALLLDEPTEGLDREHGERLVRLLAGLPAALLVASHDQAFLDAVTTRALRLDGGRLHETPR